ncbi:alpha/beta fold hydrolase [Glycomyces buryatensis]|uniref:Alpha/beta hydrolase n=1 Tax=Glycomyces buryatensis TaxID=2570927 RepID=A0A4S8Q7U7_9ACTN|nr:alpha/beta fold hydrolase [Glycomyces buryatensis]THV39421.1 alpha/beta hydrolase [Glycomyces buryatensis]
MRRSTRHLAAAAAAVLATTLLAAAPAAAAGPTHHGIDWQPCAEVDPVEEVDCATITVPLDYSKPWGEKIEIGLARRQAANPDEKLGTILMDPGGPGGSGVEVVKQVNVLTGEAAERFDLVGFDPRGVNSSTQVLCGEDAMGAVASIGVPTDQESFESLEAANSALTDDCRERTGELFDHVSNLETVEDMERIRRALGEGKLNYLGYSYGTIMGQQYAERYPRHIRTMVLDGNMDHSLESTWDFMSTETAPVEENFDAFADWCESEPECALHGQDVRAGYADLKASARAGELVDPYTGEPLDFYGLTGIYTFAANFPQDWPLLAEDYAAMLAGESLPGTSQLQEPEAVENLFYPAWCSDYGFEIADFAELDALQGKLAAEYPDVEWTPYDEFALACVGSGIENTNERGELDIDHAPELLFIGNEHDFATVYEWSETASAQADGNLLTYEGYLHTIYGGTSECIDDLTNAYFVERAVPDEGASCPNLDFPGATVLSERRLPGAVSPY